MSTINDLSTVSSVSSADKLPVWSNANGVTRGLPISVLDSRYITQDQISLLAISPTPEIFSAGDGSAPNTFVPGVTLGLTLKNLYFSADNIEVFFDGTFQGSDQYTLVGFGLVFSSPIPGGTSKVYIRGGSARQIGVPGDGTVGTLQLADLSVTTGKLALGAVGPSQFQSGAITNVAVAANAGIDSSKIAYQRAAVGAAMRLLFDKLGDRYDAHDFTGIVGDGVTDCTAGINAALVAMGPGVLIFPAGVFNTTGNHTLAQGQYIAGAGKNATQIFNTSATNDTFKLPNTFSGIKDLTIDGTAARTAGSHVNANGAISHTYLSRLSIFHFADAGVKLNGVVQYIDELDISIPTITTGSGILITGGGDQYIRGITFDGRIGGVGTTQCFAGINISNNGGVWCSDSDFIHAQIGVLLVATNVVTQFMFFDNVAADTCSNNGWLITTSGTGQINNCAFSQCWGASATNNGLQVAGVPGSIDGLTFSNFRSIANGTDGIFLQSGCVNVNFVGGLVSGNSLSPTLTTAGIHIGAGISDIIINGMRVGPTGHNPDTQLTQILVDPGAGNRISIVGCNLHTANTPITFNATGANNVIDSNTGFLSSGFVIATTDAAGHIVVTHGAGAAPKSVRTNVSNGGAAIISQPDTFTTTNFRVTFFAPTTGGVIANTAVAFSWDMSF